jgi:6-pyruvoyl-tetrahydropterin synthase
MAIENFEEVKQYFETNKDNDDVKGFVNGFSNLDVFKNKISTDSDFKKFVDSEKDKHSAKALETWKQNNLSKLIDDEIKKRFPEVDPKDVELKKLQAQIEKMQQDSTKKELTNKALKVATEKKLPTELVDFVVGTDEESTNANLTKLEKIFIAHDEAIKKQFVKDTSYVPPTGNETKVKSEADKIREQIRKSIR